MGFCERIFARYECQEMDLGLIGRMGRNDALAWELGSNSNGKMRLMGTL